MSKEIKRGDLIVEIIETLTPEVKTEIKISRWCEFRTVTINQNEIENLVDQLELAKKKLIQRRK